MSTEKQIAKRNRALKKADDSRARERARKAKTFWHEDHFSATVEAHHAQQRQEEEYIRELDRIDPALDFAFDVYLNIVMFGMRGDL